MRAGYSAFRLICDTQAEAIYAQVDTLEALCADQPAIRWVRSMRQAIDSRNRAAVWAAWFRRPPTVHRHVEELF